MIVDLFKQIKTTPSTNDKVALLKSYRPNETLYGVEEDLKTILKTIYDPFVIFGITSSQIKMRKTGSNKCFPYYLYEKVLKASGRNEKIEIIESAMPQHTLEVWNYFLRGLDKDLGINIGIKLINKAFPNLVPDFGVMLAFKQTKEKFNTHFGKLKFVYLNIKIDGIRCICQIKDQHSIKFLSRDGKELQPFLTENIKNDIIRNIDSFQNKTLDGEIYSDKFHKLMTVVNRKNINADSMLIRNSCKYAIFDIVEDEMALENRVTVLELLPETTFIKKLKYVKMPPDYNKFLDIAKHYISKGYEGIMIKNPQSFYEYKRTNNILKFKDKKSIDLEIIGYGEGEQGTKYEAQLGYLVLDHDGTEVRCGSGFTDLERIELWNDRLNLVGKICEIEFVEQTHLDSFRHPVFITIRSDKKLGGKENGD